MTDLHAAAERLRDLLEAKSIDWANASDECWADVEAVLRAAVLDPTSLLRRPVWEGAEEIGYYWKSVFGLYSIRKHTTYDYWWWQFKGGELYEAPSLEAAQSAAWLDFVERMLPAFVGLGSE